MTEQGELIGGRYLLSQRLGTGRGDYTWVATDTARHRTVNAKPRKVAADLRNHLPGAMGLARSSMKFKHPGSVPVFDVLVENDTAWLITEPVPGRSMTDFLTEFGTLGADHTAMLGSQIAGALAAAHGRNMVHRAVEPDNVLLADDGTVQIMNWGLGTLQADKAFLAPEVVAGRPATAWSDVFSLGCTLFYAMEGELPFGSDSAERGFEHLRFGRDEPDSPVERDLRSVLRPMLDADPVARPSMSGVATALTVVADGRTPSIDALAATARPRGSAPAASPGGGATGGASANGDFSSSSSGGFFTSSGSGSGSGAGSGGAAGAGASAGADQYVWPSASDAGQQSAPASVSGGASGQPARPALAGAAAGGAGLSGMWASLSAAKRYYLLLAVGVVLAALVGIGFTQLFIL